MRVLVVYESVLGNTRAVAEAVATGLRSADRHAVVRCLPAARVLAEPVEADLVVVGGPTHFFGLPAERTRRLWVEGVLRRGREEGATASLEPGAVGPGLREWFDELACDADAAEGAGGGAAEGGPDGVASAGRRRPVIPPGALAAAFDTRLDRSMSGGAARRIAQLLRRHGYHVIARPKGFVVESIAGPLRAGEQERARAWGAELGLAAEWWLRAARDARWIGGSSA